MVLILSTNLQVIAVLDVEFLKILTKYLMGPKSPTPQTQQLFGNPLAFESEFQSQAPADPINNFTRKHTQMMIKLRIGTSISLGIRDATCFTFRFINLLNTN
jgi:hypothetical protein